jgi:hypothetical protein
MAILERILRADEQIPMWTTNYNGAQSACMRPGFDFDWQKYEGQNVTGADFFENVLVVVPEEEPVVIAFQSLDYDAVFKRFPQAKIIIIGFTQNDILEIGKNHFWQMFVDDQSSRKYFDELRKQYAYLFTSSLDISPEDLTAEEKQKVYNILGGMALLSGYGHFVVPENRKENVFCLYYNDMMCDPDKTLADLSTITGVEINDFVRGEYLTHLEKHKVFLESVV